MAIVSDPPLPNPASAAITVEVETAMMRWIDRLEYLVETETQALQAGKAINFAGFNSKKSHALLEFMIVSRNVTDVSASLATSLERLRTRLARNADVLEHHLRAMSEISKLLIDNIRAEESDGTYTPPSVAETAESRR